jgi:sugar phosphate isomerase/epimerase
VSHLYLSLNPALDGQTGFLQRFIDAGWTISATMVGFGQEDYSTLDSIKRTGGIVPETAWPQNKTRVLEAIKMTLQLGVPYLEFHFGFIDSMDRTAFERLKDKAKQLADAAADHEVVLLMETGQETAAMLYEFMDTARHPALAVNFDPGNMILYGRGSPIEAVKTLGRWIRHVHVKDALPAQTVGQWGCEVPWTTGKVDADAFLKTLNQMGYQGGLLIEREAGANRLNDIESAIGYLSSWSDADAD